MLCLYSSILLCSALYFFLGPAKDVTKRNLAPTPSFRRRRGVSSSAPAPISTAVPAFPLVPSYVEDEEVSPHGTDLGPRKRRAVDGGASVLVAVYLPDVSPEVVLQDTMMTLAEGGAGAALEVPRLEEVDVAASLRSKGNKAAMGASNESLVLPGHEEAASAKLAQEAADEEKGKLPAK